MAHPSGEVIRLGSCRVNRLACILEIGGGVRSGPAFVAHFFGEWLDFRNIGWMNLDLISDQGFEEGHCAEILDSGIRREENRV